MNVSFSISSQGQFGDVSFTAGNTKKNTRLKYIYIYKNMNGKIPV